MRDLPEGRLDKKVVVSWRLGNVISSVIMGAVLIGAAAMSKAVVSAPVSSLLMILAVALTAVIFLVSTVVTPAIRYARFRFAVNEADVDIVRGIFVRKRTIIPLVRVQHVDTRQGPILRSLSLASVSIATAAGAHEIPGLSVEEADALRDKVAVLAGVAQEDV